VCLEPLDPPRDCDENRAEQVGQENCCQQLKSIDDPLVRFVPPCSTFADRNACQADRTLSWSHPQQMTPFAGQERTQIPAYRNPATLSDRLAAAQDGPAPFAEWFVPQGDLYSVETLEIDIELAGLDLTLF
jgi:hypothetical protein